MSNKQGVSQQSGIAYDDQGANGDTVFGTAKRKPQIVQLVKALFATKKP
jgi:hypothetical protein